MTIVTDFDRMCALLDDMGVKRYRGEENIFRTYDVKGNVIEGVSIIIQRGFGPSSLNGYTTVFTFSSTGAFDGWGIYPY
jgi:hypothetical protein